jgi:hypothetical protein
MKRLHAMIARGAEILGWPGILGLGLLAFVAGFYFSTYYPQQMRLDNLRSEALTLDEKRAHSGGAGPKSSGEQLTAFYGFFPPSDHVADLLGKLYGIANKESVKLEQGDYRAVRDTVGMLTHYQVTFPLKGTYSQLRKFVATALAEVPNLSLESIQFERQKVGDSMVDAKVKLVLYLGQRS